VFVAAAGLEVAGLAVVGMAAAGFSQYLTISQNFARYKHYITQKVKLEQSTTWQRVVTDVAGGGSDGKGGDGRGGDGGGGNSGDTMVVVKVVVMVVFKVAVKAAATA
jgi:hypothetical protein